MEKNGKEWKIMGKMENNEKIMENNEKIMEK